MIRKLSAACGLVLISTAAVAHPGHEHLSSFASGFAHPFMGADHFLAMFALGIWAAQWKGPSMFLAPALFILSMSIGAVFAWNGGSIHFAEHGIAWSVLAIGLLIATVPAHGRIARLALPLIAAGAAMHGYAHAVEAPMQTSGAGFISGFVMATAMLHGAGILLGRQLRERRDLKIVSGFGVAMAGSTLLWALT